MIRPKNQTEDLLISSTKNCENLIEQTHTRPEKTLEFKKTKPIETFHFNPTVQIKRHWMLGLTSLKVNKSIFIKTPEKNKFKLHNFPDEKTDSVSYEKVRDEIGRDLDISNTTATDLQEEILAPIIIKDIENK